MADNHYTDYYYGASLLLLNLKGRLERHGFTLNELDVLHDLNQVNWVKQVQQVNQAHQGIQGRSS